jgi:Domain of unknown function (DUF6456)
MTRSSLSKSAVTLLAQVASGTLQNSSSKTHVQSVIRTHRKDVIALIAADLLQRNSGGSLKVTPAGLARLARGKSGQANSGVGPYRAQHLELAARVLDPADGALIVDEAESPLAWLARRKGRDGRALIEPVQLQAGERLRADFTRSQLMPRTTANWNVAVTYDRGGNNPLTFTETVIAARQRVRAALSAVGPEFSGLLVDVCCFLKGLADVERERAWPPRSAKVVLQLGLERLARHYGLGAEARGRAHAPVRTWLAPDVSFTVD